MLNWIKDSSKNQSLRKRAQSVFFTVTFESSVYKRNSFVLVSSRGEKVNALCDARVLLLFRIEVRGSNESQYYTFFSIWSEQVR